MSMLFVGKYKPGIYQSLSKDEKDAAQLVAQRLFGYDYGFRRGTSESGVDYDKNSPVAGYDIVEPKANIEFKFADSFRWPQSGDKKIGWVTVVANESYDKMLDELQWPDGPLCRMYDIDVIPLHGHDTTYEVYEYMTPSHWS